jgi:16S rRNA (guanine527-N7)-methyltransferase
MMLIGSQEWSDLIIESAASLGIDLTRTHTRQFATHAAELGRWNQKFNITAITDPHQVAVKHFVDSLLVARFVAGDATLLDIGTGGGFPGLPLKVLLPSLNITLIDASRKRVHFLKHVIRSLKMDQIEALHVRAEMLAGNRQFLKRYHVVTSRALSSLKLFCELAWPFAADNGLIIALKGEVDNEELRHLQEMEFVHGDDQESTHHEFVVSVEKFRLPVLNFHRSVVVIRKTA